jgi:hypothetical protein
MEWSSWTRASRASETFGQTQPEWQSKVCGSSFWTIKMDWMPGGDWGFKEQVDTGAITALTNLTLPAAEVIQILKTTERRSLATITAIQTRQSFWDNKGRGGRFKHWRFADGVSDNPTVCRRDGSLGRVLRPALVTINSS